METKFSTMFTNGSVEPKKQVGCMSGIFQLFDCQLFINGRQPSEEGHKDDNTSDQFSRSSNRNQEPGFTEDVRSRTQENSRCSMDSTSTSFSSSFASLSSLEQTSPQNGTIYTHHHSLLSERSPRSSPRARSAAIFPSPAFKDIIKETFYRESRIDSIEEEEEVHANRVMRHVHSPRPVGLSNLKSPLGFNEACSPRFSCWRETMHHDTEERELPRISSDSMGDKFSVVAKLMGLELKQDMRGHEKLLQSPRAGIKSPRSSEEARKEEDARPASSVKEKELQKLQYQHLHRKKTTLKSRSSFTERAFNSPILIMEPTRKLGSSSSIDNKLQQLPGLGEVAMKELTRRNKGLVNVRIEREQASIKRNCIGIRPSLTSKDPCERQESSPKSSRLHQVKHETKTNGCEDFVSSCEPNKSKSRPVDRLPSEPVSPRVRNKVSSDQTQKSSKKKIHKRLVFDMGSEILHSGCQRHQRMFQSRKLISKHVCKELCLMIKKEGNVGDKLAFDKELGRSLQPWNFDSEVPLLVLDIERLIFKDLINEVVGHG